MKHDLSLHIAKAHKTPIIPVIAKAGRFYDRQAPMRDVFEKLTTRAAGADAAHPMVMMIHGQGFDPGIRRADPYRTIFAYDPYGDRIADYWRLQSWVHRFKDAAAAPANALMIGYGWQACAPDFVTSANLNEVARKAVTEAQFFSQFICRLRQMAPKRRLHVLAHGLGAKVVLRALEQTPNMRIDRLVMLDAVALISDGLLAMNAKAGHKTALYNIYDRPTTRMRFFDKYCEKAGPLDHVLGFGFPFQRHRWVDVPLVDRVGMYNLFDEHPRFAKRRCAKSFPAHFHSDALITYILSDAVGSDVAAIKTKLNDRLRPYQPKRRYAPLWINPLNYVMRPV
ncbi:MAG: hypothetical protein AAF429_13175 [Pseudomonadota bacterium]